MIRLQVLQSLETVLRSIRIENDYLTDIGKNVTYWDVYDKDYKGSPSVTFRDKNTLYELIGITYENRLIVEVEAIGYVRQATKLIDSCNLYSDLIKALILKSWSNQVIAVRLKNDSKDIESQAKQAISFIITLEIEYRDDLL